MINNMVMVLTNPYDPDPRVKKEIDYFLSKGVKVHLLCWDRESKYHNDEIHENNQFTIIRFRYKAKYGTGIKQLFSYLKFGAGVRKFIKKMDSNPLLYAHDLDGFLLVFFMSKKYKKVFDMHEIYHLRSKSKIINSIKKILSRKLQRSSMYNIYVNSEQILDRTNLEKYIYLPNYCYLSNQTYRSNDKTKKVLIGYVGNVRYLEPFKLIDESIKKFSSFEFHLHGKGSSLEEVREIASNYFRVFGEYKQQDSSKIYESIDLSYLVYPRNIMQNNLSYPIKLFESIQFLTPIIAYSDTAIGRFVDEHEIGFTFSDLKGLNNILESIEKNTTIIDEKSKKMMELREEYSWERIVENLDVIVKEAKR